MENANSKQAPLLGANSSPSLCPAPQDLHSCTQSTVSSPSQPEESQPASPPRILLPPLFSESSVNSARAEPVEDPELRRPRAETEPQHDRIELAAASPENVQTALTEEIHRRAEQPMHIGRVHAAYQRRIRRLLRLHASAGTASQRDVIQRSLDALEEYMARELEKYDVRRYSAAGEPGDEWIPRAAPQRPQADPELGFTEAAILAQEQKSSAAPVADPYKTPPSSKKNLAALRKRLAGAPYSKGVVDVPDYVYNSDDEYFS